MRIKIRNSAKAWTLGLIALLVVSGWALSADQITADDAFKAAANHIEAMRGVWEPTLNNLSVLSVNELNHPETKVLLGYVVDYAPRGFIVLSASTDIYPIITYSYDGNFSSEEHPENILYWMVLNDLQLRQAAIAEDVYDEALAAEAQSRWSFYLSDEVSPLATEQWPAAGTSFTDGWITQMWHQSMPYNNYCPIDPSTRSRSIVGCVATAMGMIHDYHADRRDYMHKAQMGSWDKYVSYRTSPPIYIDDDAEELDFPTLDEMTTMLDAVRRHYIAGKLVSGDKAAISFACAIWVKMSFSSSASGSYTERVAGAFTGKLGYTSAVTRSGSSMYSRMSQNMKDSLPAEMGISGPPGGHAIVVDGLREIGGEQDQYHLNYGWGWGYPDSPKNSWYVLPQGLPAGFTTVNNAVVDIYPPDLSYQPDNMVKTSSEAEYVGDDVYYDVDSQSVPLNPSTNARIFYVKIQNDGDQETAMVVKVTKSGGENEELKCYDEMTGADITDDVLGSGWTTNKLSPGDEKDIRIEIIPSGSASTCHVNVYTEAKEDDAFNDNIQITTDLGIVENETLNQGLTLDIAGGFGVDQLNLNYYLPFASDASFKIFTSNGSLVRTLTTGNVTGHNSLVWDTRDHTGSLVTPGTYFIMLNAGNMTQTAKALIIR